MAIADSYNFRRINDRLTTSGVVGEQRLKSLGAEGYDVVINLLPDECDYVVADERQLVEEQAIKYVYIPVDFIHPTLSALDQFMSVMDTEQESKVHIHCAANYRVSAFYALYAETRKLWSQAKAQDFIESLWQPEENEGWRKLIARVRERHFGETDIG